MKLVSIISQRVQAIFEIYFKYSYKRAKILASDGVKFYFTQNERSWIRTLKLKSVQLA